MGNMDFYGRRCQKYGFRYGATFYNPQLSNIPDNLHSLGAKQEDSLLFIGTDKGRKDFLLNLKAKLIPRGIKCDFRIVDNFKSLYDKNYSREVDYFTLCHLTQKSCALLDVVQKNNRDSR